MIAAARARLGARCWVGDEFAAFNANLGPEITATLLGADLVFGERSIWSRPVVDDVAEWDEIARRRPRFDNVYWRTIEALTEAALDFADEWIVGLTDLHGSLDILAALRDPEQLCMDALDDPDRVEAAALHAADVFVEAFERNYAQVAKAGMPATCWLPAPHAGPAYPNSCDFWCMLGPDLAERLAMPTIRREIEPTERSIFHLDGPDALRHLDLLLELPRSRLQAVQWAYGAGNGPASRWMDVYRRCLEAGRGVQVIAESAADLIGVLETLGPRGLYFTLDAPLELAAAEGLLREIERLAVCTPSVYRG
jgi:hypothetical protein